MSFSSSSAGIGITLVITADPATAAAASLALLPERFIARRMASPTASPSTMFFSTTAFGGSAKGNDPAVKSLTDSHCSPWQFPLRSPVPTPAATLRNLYSATTKFAIGI
ncbi:hypothetical protein G6F32_014702 [Rhizopus arrhizus]|nr:hypothetical protein G6F32_014702 [Rhizopus arrhizus]